MDWKVIVALAVALLAACGGGADRTKAQLRLVNASSGYAQLDLRVHDQLRQAQVGYGATAGYVEVDPGEADTTITSAGSATPLLSFTPAVAEKKHYTLLAYGPAGALRQQPLDDNAGAPDTNRSLLRVFNAAPDAGALDVYLTAANESVDTAVPVAAAAAYGVLGGWITVASANWRLQVTAAGSKTELRLDLPTLALASKQRLTLVLTPGNSGVLVNALVLTQQGSIVRADARHARVRLAALVADSGTVAARLGTLDLAGTGVGSPVVDNYVLAPRGFAAVTVTVNGQALGAPDVDLVAGQDYTLMVHGPLAAPRLDWLADDNRLPGDGSRAKLRLVNALADGSAPLAMALDALPVASGVVAGAGSAYFSAMPTTGVGNSNGALSVTATGVTTPVLTATGQVFEASRVYSVFVTGPQASARGIVRRDR